MYGDKKGKNSLIWGIKVLMNRSSLSKTPIIIVAILIITQFIKHSLPSNAQSL